MMISGELFQFAAMPVTMAPMSVRNGVALRGALTEQPAYGLRRVACEPCKSS